MAIGHSNAIVSKASWTVLGALRSHSRATAWAAASKVNRTPADTCVPVDVESAWMIRTGSRAEAQADRGDDLGRAVAAGEGVFYRGRCAAGEDRADLPTALRRRAGGQGAACFPGPGAEETLAAATAQASAVGRGADGGAALVTTTSVRVSP